MQVEWLIDATGCPPERLRDVALLKQLCAEITDTLRLRTLGELWHPFPGPGGVTGMLLLAESHLTCHTYPELGSAAFNLACCRPRPEWPWAERLGRVLGARKVSVRMIRRDEAVP